MNAQVAALLITLNKQFYQTFGREFSSTRQRLQPGVLRMLDRLGGDEDLLDLGCGNGELTRELMRRGHRGHYTGLDFSLPLLEVARHGWEDLPTTFIRADLTTPGWEKRVSESGKTGKSGSQQYDQVMAFAVLHHIPGEATRRNILQIVQRLLKDGGLFIHSNWQFLNSEKLRKRIQPWSEAGLTQAEVDPGDYLLDWRSGGRGLRYVHAYDEAELAALAAATGFQVRESFVSDGENDRLGLYQVWTP